MKPMTSTWKVEEGNRQHDVDTYSLGVIIEHTREFWALCISHFVSLQTTTLAQAKASSTTGVGSPNLHF